MTSIQVSLAVVSLLAFAAVADAGDGCAPPETRADVLHQASGDESTPKEIRLEEEEEEEEEDEEPDCE